MTQEEKYLNTKCCVYMDMGVIPYQMCISDYNCLGCKINKQISESVHKGKVEVVKALERYESVPAGQRLCRYAHKKEVSYRLCSRNLRCGNCAFHQIMEEGLQQQLLQRQEAALKKQRSWWWQYWQSNWEKGVNAEAVKYE